MSHSIEDDFEEFFSDRKPVPVSAPQAMRSTAETTLDLLAWLPPERYRITDMAGTAALYFLPLTGGSERVWLGDWIVRTETGAFLHYGSSESCPHPISLACDAGVSSPQPHPLRREEPLPGPACDGDTAGPGSKSVSA